MTRDRRRVFHTSGLPFCHAREILDYLSSRYVSREYNKKRRANLLDNVNSRYKKRMFASFLPT